MASIVNARNSVANKQRDAVKQLAMRQNALIQQIMPGALSDSTGQPGLAVYRANVVASAGRALSHSYPVISAMLGDKTVSSLAARLLQSCPLASGDWATWGGELAHYLSETPLVDVHPYLSDIARVEWEIHYRSRIHTQSFDTLSLKYLQEDLTQIHLSLSPSVALIKSEFHCGAIWHSHRRCDGSIRFDKTLFEELLSNTRSTGHWLIQSLPESFVHGIEAIEFNWMKAIEKGQSLDVLLTRYPEVDFAEWLSRAIKDQLIVGFYSTSITSDLNHH